MWEGGFKSFGSKAKIVWITADLGHDERLFDYQTVIALSYE